MYLGLLREIVRSIRPFIGNKKKWSYQCRLIQLRPVLTRISAAISNSGVTGPRIKRPRPGPPQTLRRSFLLSRFVYHGNFSFFGVFLIGVSQDIDACNFCFGHVKFSSFIVVKDLMRNILGIIYYLLSTSSLINLCGIGFSFSNVTIIEWRVE